MRAITVRQPWAWAIIHGGKDVENRSRNIAGAYRGPLAIHAGLSHYEKGTRAGRVRHEMHGGEVDTRIVFGGFIGVVDLVDVHEGAPFDCGSPWAQHEIGQRTVHLELANPRPLTEPIPYRGQLGLWSIPDGIEKRITADLL